MEEEFISVWDTRKTESEIYRIRTHFNRETQERQTQESKNNQISLPLESDGEYDFRVEWGDGQSSKITHYGDPTKTHTYEREGIYSPRVRGKIKEFRFNDGGDKSKLIDITNWGPLRLGNNGSYFYGAENLEDISATDVNLEGTHNLSKTFKNAIVFNGDIGYWDVRNVRNMGEMFFSADKFNQNIGSWNVSSVKNMGNMFYSASVFNQPIGDWDIRNVRNMYAMFAYASAFNQDLSKWDVRNADNTEGMFNHAYAFDRDKSLPKHFLLDK